MMSLPRLRATVPDEYVPMVLEEMELDGGDARAPWRTTRPPTAAPRSPSWSSAAASPGCSPASACKEAGIPFTIIEKNAGVGGTWYENTYPGCRVDVGNHFYCYSFEPTDHWTEFFAAAARAAGLLRATCAKLRASTAHIRFETEVAEAAWDDDAGDVARCACAPPTAPSETLTRARA